MGTKLNPAVHDCYAAALPDEPMFILLARDPDAPTVVQIWAKQRAYQISRGSKPETDKPMVLEALQCAKAMQAWRSANDGRWRGSTPSPALMTTPEMRQRMREWVIRNPSDGHARIVGLLLDDLERSIR